MTAMDRIAALFLATLFAFTLNAAPGADAQELTTPEPAPLEWASPEFGTIGNPWTTLMQQWLRDNGFRPGPVDSWFGKNTRAAVVRFQGAVGLEQTGAWTWETSQAQINYVPPPTRGSESTSTVWDRLAQCESNGNWSISTGNGFYGGLQFTLGSWRAAGGSGYPHQNSREEQIRRAEILLDMQGWNAWPTCSSVIGVR